MKIGEPFCGAGIGGVGAKQAGFECVWAFDNNKHAVQTFNENVEPVAYVADAKKMDITELPYVDVIMAGFPCKPFSVIGKRQGEADDRYGNLGWITQQIIFEVKPKAFLLENVKGLISKRNIDFFNAYIDAFKEDYEVTWQLIDCADYGVPQKRERIFIVGIRKDLGATYIFPEPTMERISVREAIGDLPKDPDPSVPNHGEDCGIRNDEKPFVHKVPIGGNWKDLPVDDQKAFMKNAYYSTGGQTGFLWKVDPDKPSKTILSSPKGKATAQILHWEGHEPRRFTVRESLRLQTVPDSFVFSDDIPLMKQYERCSGIPTKVAELFLAELKKQLSDAK